MNINYFPRSCRMSVHRSVGRGKPRESVIALACPGRDCRVVEYIRIIIGPGKPPENNIMMIIMELKLSSGLIREYKCRDDLVECI